MHLYSRRLSEIGVLVTVAVALLAGPVGPALAAHGDPANFTVMPAGDYDRQPGIEDASYKTFSKPPKEAEFDGFRYLGYSVLEWNAGTLGNCGITDNEVAGIDRYNDDPGTEIDEDVRDNIEGQPVSNEDRIVIDFDDPGKIGHQPVYMNTTDEFVSHVTNCRGNPDQPGWYQLTGTINGTTWSDEHVERTTNSHYFYICDCTSYDEAVASIGPPPSRETATPTPSPSSGQTTPTDTTTETAPSQTSDTPTIGPGDSPTTIPSGTDTTQPLTPTSDDSTPTPARWARRTVQQGPGFGIGVGMVALLAVVAVARLR